MPWHNLHRHLSAWKAAWQDRNRLPGPRGTVSKEAEFLPAVLEIQDSPPSPIGRAIGALIIGVFVAAILWAAIGKMDIVAVAQGKIIPGGHSKVIQPLESGVIRHISVQNGQTVQAGEVLIALDPTQTSAERERLYQERLAVQLEGARIRALIDGQNTFVVPEETSPALVAIQQQRLHNQVQEYRARLAAAQQLIAQRRAALAATQSTVVRLKTTLPMLQERATAFRRLLAKDYVSRVEYFEAEKSRVDEQQELARQREIFLGDKAGLQEAAQNYRALVSEFQQARHAELSAVESQIASLTQELIKAEQRSGLQRLRAPTAGVVQQLAVHSIGGVVTPAQQLMVIVPKDHHLEIEAWVENNDIGFVKAGQLVETKVASFPFTRYGVVEGEILSISNDAVPLDEGGLVYAARVAMHTSTVEVENKLVNLSPGMAVTVEIKTGHRRLLEFFLSPLLRGIKETARER